MNLYDFEKRLLSINLDKIIESEINNEQTEQYLLRANKNSLWDGKTTEGQDITPNYYTDPFFKGDRAKSEKYIRYKQRITKNSKRKRHIPNLYIIGTFYNSIKIHRNNDTIKFYTTGKLGKKITNKFKDILGIGGSKKELFFEQKKKKVLSKIYNILFKDAKMQ